MTVAPEQPAAEPHHSYRAAETCRATAVFMDTVVAITVVHHDVHRGGAVRGAASADCEPLVARAFDRFREVETRCTRFDPESELMRLCAAAGGGARVLVSPLLFRALACALDVAQASGGAFDPTVGRALEASGFDEHYRTGARIAAGRAADRDATFRDVHLHRAAHTVAFTRPLLLDLGAVAKGLAIDLAAEALAPLRDFAIDAGGDVYVAGAASDGAPWPVGVRDPRRSDALIDVWRASDAAICSSGDYERRRPGDVHHIVEPRSGRPARASAAVTVAAPSAMVADALATAAFVLGPEDGVALLEASDVDGIVVTPAREVWSTRRVHEDWSTRRAA